MLEPANKPIQHNYFLASGLASVIAIGKNGHRLEVGIIGREGMTGLPVVLGNDRSPNETFIQVKSRLCIALRGASSFGAALPIRLRTA
jgi:CRP-like cAMP-binding protein